MVRGDVEGLELVVRRLDLRAGDDGVAQREKYALDLLEGLPKRMARPERAHHAGKRKVFAFAGQRPLIGRRFNRHAPRFQRPFDMRLQLIQRLANQRLQFRLCWLEPSLSYPSYESVLSSDPANTGDAQGN